MFTIYSDLVHNRTLRTIWYKKTTSKQFDPQTYTHTPFVFVYIYIPLFFHLSLSIVHCFTLSLCVVVYVCVCFYFLFIQKISLFWCFSFDIIFFQNEILYVYAKHKNNIKKFPCKQKQQLSKTTNPLSKKWTKPHIFINTKTKSTPPWMGLITLMSLLMLITITYDNDICHFGCHNNAALKTMTANAVNAAAPALFRYPSRHWWLWCRWPCCLFLAAAFMQQQTLSTVYILLCVCVV